jgi:hypothetical protein
MWFINMLVCEIPDVFGNVFSAIIVGILAWLFREKIRGVIHKPKLCFELKDNDGFNDGNPQYSESKYDIFCHNDDERPFRIVRISLKSKCKTIYDRPISFTDDSIIIKEHGNYAHKIVCTGFDNIKDHCKKHKVKNCKIIVYTCDGKYSYNFSLAKFGSEASNLHKALRGLKNRK